MKSLVLCGLAACALLCSSCASSAKSQAKKLFECSEKVQEAVGKYQKKRYSTAQFILTDVIAKCPGHSSADTAIFYLGKSLLGLKRPEEAKVEFERLTQSYPNSPFAEESRFLQGYSSYRASAPWNLDQASTKEALQRLKEFAETYPQSPYADSARAYSDSCTEKLAKKEFEAAKFYEKIAQYDAAIVYLKAVAEDFPQSNLLPQVKIAMAENLLLTKRPAEAEAIINDLLEHPGDEAILKKARSIKARIRKQQ